MTDEQKREICVTDFVLMSPLVIHRPHESSALDPMFIGECATCGGLTYPGLTHLCTSCVKACNISTAPTGQREE